MCLAVPARLLSCSHDQAVADLHGTRVRISTVLVPDALPGDWVLVHAGFAIQRLEPQDVAEVWTAVNQFQAHVASQRPAAPTPGKPAADAAAGGIP